LSRGRVGRKTLLHPSIHWRHLANTIERLRGGGAVLCQITLTTCLVIAMF